jgi:ectoine hydroxylase-related dioxygenase (phytanoyl-CoA dioxygenase family)
VTFAALPDDDMLRRFDEDGYVLLRGVLGEAEAAELATVVAENTRKIQEDRGTPPNERALVLDFLSVGERLVDLVDHPRILPLVAAVLGSNIYLYHTHWCVAPSVRGRSFPNRQHFLHLHNAAADTHAELADAAAFWRWHRDGGQINQELGPHPQPRLSLKAGVFLTDLTEPGGGNMAVIPGSHKRDLAMPPAGARAEDSVEILARRGDVVVFDRRLVHSSTPNLSPRTRLVLFYGYAYRWLRPRDDMTVGRWLADASPVRRQLLGATSSGYAYSSPAGRDLPLAGWLAERGAVAGPLEKL